MTHGAAVRGSSARPFSSAGAPGTSDRTRCGGCGLTAGRPGRERGVQFATTWLLVPSSTTGPLFVTRQSRVPGPSRTPTLLVEAPELASTTHLTYLLKVGRKATPVGAWRSLPTTQSLLSRR